MKKSFLLLVILCLIPSLPRTQASSAKEEGAYTIYLPLIPNKRIYDPIIEGYLHQINSDRLYNYTNNLVVTYSPRHHDFYNVYKNHVTCPLNYSQTYKKNNLNRSLDDTKGEFEILGYSTTVEKVADNYGGGYNIVAHKPASSPYPTDTIIDIGAHIDADKDWEDQTSTPAAVDNAVGVAALLEMAAILKNYPNNHPWQFVVFVAEEHGRHGSKLHAQVMVNKPFKGALILDGIGWSEIYPDYMNCSWAKESIPYSVRMAELFDLTRKSYQIPIQWRRCDSDVQVSDNVSYYEVNLPAVLSIGGMPYADPNYHSCGDNMANIDTHDWTNAIYTIQENIGVLLEMDKEP